MVMAMADAATTNGNHQHAEDADDGESTPSALRIASLLPSTTDICISLRLERRVVGVTHECDFPSSSHPLFLSPAPLVVDGGANGVDGKDDGANEPPSPPLTLTVSQIDPDLQSQVEIDSAVKSSLHDGISLYNLNGSSLADAAPTIILTQSLCDVCAVATSDVNDEVACNFRPGECRVVSLEPESLEEVVESFVTVAEACGVKRRGEELSHKFWAGMHQISHATSLSKRGRKPTVLFLEWMDPPFDAGHWIPDMLERGGCISALSWSKSTPKSVQLSWERVYECDPDVVVVGCCGFDLARNERDALAARERLAPLRAFRDGNVYATDGNLYFARPGPGLREGAAILARCAYDGDGEAAKALEGLDFLPREGEGWSRIAFPEGSSARPSGMLDVEDLCDENGHSKLHDEACRAELDFYEDPKTGYSVYTEHAHKKRGKCCGSGCRHCPYNHVNVRDKAMRIQQPAFLYEGDDSSEDALFMPLSSIPLSSIPPRSHVKVLFFSGGKDSFLAIRSLVRERRRRASTSSSTFHLILLTTFDAKSRVIAHQEVPIDTVLRQARHLEIPLLGIPLHRGSGEKYSERIDKGIDAIHTRVPDVQRTTLVFGDLHLDHIREWRERELSSYELEYPLWKVPYEDLMEDLDASGVRATLSAVTAKDGGLEVGMSFTRELWKEAVRSGMDGFGEDGEFHSVVEVWTATRERALGLQTEG